MATIYATHAAAAVKQITTVTIANTWATADVATLTMNGKALVVTIGADTSTTQVAQAIMDAWNATERLNSENGGTDATSNFGGQEFGEYAEVVASIDPDAASVVILTARKAGVPFTVTVTETTAGSGTATGASAQAATGPWHWDNGANWSGAAAPANDDVVVLKDQSGDNVGFKYGLPNASKEVTIQHWMSYTGQIGLPPINRDNGSKPYNEYRQRYVRLDDAGGGTDIAHRFGLGKDGTGSPLINLKHSTVKCSPIVYNTGTSQISGLKALNICATTDTSTLHIAGGSVDWSSQDGSTTAFVTVTQSGGDSRGVSGLKTGAVVNMQGGTMLLGGIADGTITALAGTLRCEGLPTPGPAFLAVHEGAVVEYSSIGTIDVLDGNGGTVDFRGDVGDVTIEDTVLNKPTKIIDPYRRITFTNPATVAYDVSADLQLGASSASPLKITFS